MRKLFFISVLTLSLVFSVNAHPAKKVNLTYQNGVLKIEVIHKVKDVKTHYIDQIVINVDGIDIKTIDLQSQNSNNAETLELTIPEIKKGSKVIVKTRCNKIGTKVGKLTIE